MVTLISYPDALSLSQNLKKIVASADGQSAFLLYKNGELVIDETYFPDESGTIEIDIRELVTSLLSVSVPTSDTYIQSNSYADFSFTIGGETKSFRAIKGGINNLSSAQVWLKGNFLTWQPQTKVVTHNQPEWLTYYAQENVTVVCKLYNQDGSSSTVQLATIAAGECASINTQFARCINLTDTSKLAYYDIWVEGAGVRFSFVQRYVLRNETTQEKLFIFENSVGGMDSVSFTGSENLEAESEHETVQMADAAIQGAQQLYNWRQQSTGYRSAYEAKWLQDFFTSAQRYVHEDANLKAIVLQSSSLAASSSESVKEYTFTYRIAEDVGLLNLNRNMDSLAQIEFPTAEQIFFLAPRLSDFSEAQINPYLIIPVQSPYEGVWYRISIASIETLMQQMVTQGLEGNVHNHWNKEVIDALSEMDGELAYKGVKLNLSLLQYLGVDEYGNMYLRNKDDGEGRNLSTDGKFISKEGFQTKEYLEGLLGKGAKIDGSGNAEMHSLSLRTFLEVPELRYNRVEVKVGDKWRAPGGGIIERVQPDENGTSGTAWLKLEEGEIGAIAVDDICMGIYHNFKNKKANATQDYDDGKGNREFSGFCTVYFRITEVVDYSDENGITWHRKQFRYSIRPVSSTWSKQMNPMQFMNFVAYGNFTNTERQTSVYETRTYTRFLKGQNSWEIGIQNIAKQEGDLSNLKTAFGKDLSGYSSYQTSMFLTGVIKQVKEDGTPIQAANERGAWVAGAIAGYYDRFSHKGSLWLCVAENGTNTEPSENDPAWLLEVKAGASITASTKWSSEKTPYPMNTMLRFADKIVISNIETSEPPYPLLTDEKGNYIQQLDGSYILLSEEINPSWYLLLDTPDLTNGEDGAGLQVQYSKDGSSWHDVFAQDDIYMRQRVGEDSWTDAIRIVGEAGKDGVASEYTSFEFAVNTSLTEAPTTGWQDAPPPVGKGQHLWLRTGIIIPPAKEPETWTCARISGETGNGIQSVVEYYQVSGSNSVVPSSWVTTMPTLTQANKYLWNYEKITYTDGQTVSSTPIVIGMFSKDGNGITSVVEKYGLSSSADVQPTAWVDEILKPTQSVRFLWNKTTTSYTDTTPVTTIRVIAVYGEAGKDGKDGQDGKDGKDGKDGLSYNHKGAWATSKMPAKKMDVYTMGGKMYVALCDTSNPPLFTLTDAAGNRLMSSSGGYILTGEENTAEWEMLIKSGEDGKGYEWIFQRNSTGTRPAKPASSQVDDYVPSGWTDDAQGVTASIPYEFACHRTKVNGVWSDFSTPFLAYKYGEKGETGPQGPQGIAGADGIPGAKGLDGCVIRYAEWQKGYEWHNDEGATSGTRYIDFAFVRSESATTGYNVFKCKKTHVSSDSNAPDNTTYWEEATVNVPAIFTNIIIGKSAHIDLMQGNDMLVKKADATVTAGLSGTQEGDKTRIWAGATQENKDVAPFAVNEDGVVTAEVFRTGRGGCRMEAKNGVISIFGSIAKNIEFGVNNEGLAVLRYYDNDGSLLYDLGPKGITSVKRANDSWRTIRLAYVGASVNDIFSNAYWDIVQWPFYNKGTDYYQFLSGYIGNAYNDPLSDRKVFKAKSKVAYIPDGWYVEVNNDNIIDATERMTYVSINGEAPPMHSSNPFVDVHSTISMQIVTRYSGGEAVEILKTYFNVWFDNNIQKPIE